jgi:hypothetical protein
MPEHDKSRLVAIKSACFDCRVHALGLFALALLSGCGQTPDGRAAAAVERLGGKLKFAGEDAHRAVVEVDLSRTPATDADLDVLRPLAQLRAVNLSGAAITDRGLAALGDCRSLKKLNLNLTKISDAGLASLADLPELEELYLIETALTDASAADLQRLGHLKQLVLLRTSISSAAVNQLRRQLPNTLIQIEPRLGRLP